MNNNPNDITKLSARHTDQVEEAPDPDSAADPAAKLDNSPSGNVVYSQTYQDDFDARSKDIDPFANEVTEDPAQLLQIPSKEFKKELDGLSLDDSEEGTEDMRETIEDRDEDDDSPASTNTN